MFVVGIHNYTVILGPLKCLGDSQNGMELEFQTRFIKNIFNNCERLSC